MTWVNKIKTIWVVTASLTVIAIAGLAYGQHDITYVAVGALAGWVGGNKNGQRRDY
jgi:hypothetical protein